MNDLSAAPLTVDARRLRTILAVLMVGAFLPALDQTVVATALPTIAGDLGSLSHLSWVVTAYLLATAVTTPLYGKLGDLYGRKTLFQIAILIFLVGSALCGASQSMGELIACRALQGIGAGGLTVGSQAILGDVVAPADRGRYSGLMASVYATSSILGPLVGGVLTQSLSWRWIFYVNLPLGAAVLVTLALVLPTTSRRVEHRLDYAGIVVLGATAAGLILTLTWGGTQYAWTSPVIIILGVATIGLGVAAGFIESRAAEPVIPPRLFTNRVFRVSAPAGAATSLLLIGMATFLPLFLQNVRQSSPTLSGLQTAPITIASLVASFWVGRRIAALGTYQIYARVGGGIIAVGAFLTAIFGATSGASYADLAGCMAVLGLGLGATGTIYNLTTQNSVPYRDMGAAIATASFCRVVGASIGVSIFGEIFTHQLTADLRAQHAQLTSLGGNAAHLTPAQLHVLRTHSPTLYRQITHAFDHALHGVFLAGIGFGLLAFALALLLPELPLRRVNAPTESPAPPPTAVVSP